MIEVGCYGGDLEPLWHRREVVAIVSVVQNDGFDWLLKVIYCPYLEKPILLSGTPNTGWSYLSN